MLIIDGRVETLELTITDLSRGGSGVARDAGGRVVFVPLTAPGDRVEVQIIEQEKNYAQGRLLKVLHASPQRQAPRCPHFGECGGCQWQHIPYDLQWKTKLGGVLHALDRVQIKPDRVEEFPAERIWEYRNRIQLRGIGGSLGFFKPGSRDLVPAERCDIARPEINAAWEETRTTIPKQAGMYKVEIEVTGEGRILRTINAGHAAQGFRQIHDEQNDKLRDWVKGVISKSRSVLDLYGGVGNLSLGMAPLQKQIECVDVSAPREAAPGTPSNYQYHRSSVLPWLMKAAQKGRRTESTSVIVDPPREGLGADGPEIINCAKKLGVDEWVAIGCDPDSFARDLSRLIRHGWQLQRVAVFDLFPQTPHVESAALLRYN